jgi:hypothetical protein
MLIIRTSFQISDSFLTHLSQLIHKEVTYLSSYGDKIDLTADFKYYDKIFAGTMVDSVPYLLTLNTYCFYHEPIISEVNLLNIGFYSPDIGHPDLLKTPLGQTPFKIQKIKIFGQERTSVWDQEDKARYFERNVNLDIGDYYFNILLLRLESFDGRFINFWAHNRFTGLSFEKEVNLERAFQSDDQRLKSDEFIPEKMLINIQDIKCHYEIDETGIQKNINDYSELYS